MKFNLGETLLCVHICVFNFTYLYVHVCTSLQERYLADMQDKETSRVKQMLSHLSVPQKVEVYESGLQLLKDQDTHLKNAQCLPSIKISGKVMSIYICSAYIA